MFHDHSVDGTVRMTYDAQVYYGRVHGLTPPFRSPRKGDQAR